MSSEQARQYIVAGILPFNLIKGAATGVIFVLLFSKMKQWITRRVVVYSIALPGERFLYKNLQHVLYYRFVQYLFEFISIAFEFFIRYAN